MKELIKKNVRWIFPVFDSSKYGLIFFGEKIIAISHLGKEHLVLELGQFVKNRFDQKDSVPINATGYIIEIRNPDTVDKRSLPGNENPNGEYVIDVLFENEGVRRRTMDQIEPCLNWWEKE